MFESLGSPIAIPWDVSRGIAPGGGKTFYVRSSQISPAGSDDNEGTDPQYPLLKIQAAIDKCDQRRHDYIFVQDSYQEDVVSILCNKRNIHLIGLSEGNPLGGRALVDMQGVDACFKTYGTGGSLELAGFRMGSSGNNACIEVAENSWFNHIHHCSFGHFLPARDGILCEGSNHIQSWLVDHCDFSYQLTRDGIRVENPAHSSFLHNFFRVSAGKGINITGGTMLKHIGDNDFVALIATDLDAGWAITLGSGVNWGMVSHNRASKCGDASGNSPYLDQSSNAVGTLLNGWANNFDGPALSGGPDTA